MQRKSVLTVLSVLLSFGTVLLGALFLKNQYYYPVSVLAIVFGCLPFIAAFRKYKSKTRELTLVSCMTALAVASRAAFYMVPSVKPMCAIAIIAGVAFGAETGFAVGALSMFLSNFMFGQGAWTPFQVFGMGITAFVASVILRRGNLQKNRVACAIVGAVTTFLLYGGIVDTGSALLLTRPESVNAAVSVYLAGIPFNVTHAVTTAVVLAALMIPLGEKLTRVRIKYGLFKEEKNKAKTS